MLLPAFIFLSVIVGASAREAYGVHTEATYCRTEVKQTVVVSCVFTYNKNTKLLDL